MMDFLQTHEKIVTLTCALVATSGIIFVAVMAMLSMAQDQKEADELKEQVESYKHQVEYLKRLKQS